MFDALPDGAPAPPIAQRQTGDEVPTQEKLVWERELLGVYFSRPLDALVGDVSSRDTLSCGEITMDLIDRTVKVTGIVVSVRQAYTRDRRPFVVASIEDLDASIEVIAWPRLYESTQSLWQAGNMVTVKGTVKVRDGEVKLNCEDVTLLPARQEVMKEPDRRHVMIDINQSEDSAKDVERLHKVTEALKSYPGQDTVSLIVVSDGHATRLDMPAMTVNYCPELAAELTDIVGKGSFRIGP
jgi:DNA polymerase III subunit alpha